MKVTRKARRERGWISSEFRVVGGGLFFYFRRSFKRKFFFVSLALFIYQRSGEGEDLSLSAVSMIERKTCLYIYIQTHEKFLRLFSSEYIVRQDTSVCGTKKFRIYIPN